LVALTGRIFNTLLVGPNRSGLHGVGPVGRVLSAQAAQALLGQGQLTTDSEFVDGEYLVPFLHTWHSKSLLPTRSTLRAPAPRAQYNA
jgi:hypothetical protein